MPHPPRFEKSPRSRPASQFPAPAAGGFTLVELVVVVAITGIIAALGGLLISRPMQGYVDLVRRAELVDAADNALRRMQRDIRRALPNSVRLTSSGGDQYLELLPTIEGDRYRAQGPGDILDFTLADTGFDVLGVLDSVPAGGQELVIYNLAATGTSGNAYFGDNRAAVTGGTLSSVSFAAKQFPLQSPDQRFFLIEQPVSYVCTPGAGGGTLWRYTGYGVTAVQPTAFAAGTVTLLASHVTGCAFTYSAGSSQRAGLVSLRLTLADQGETITLLHQTHVDNAP
jgi:MSHA biogenesis protein MshO